MLISSFAFFGFLFTKAQKAATLQISFDTSSPYGCWFEVPCPRFWPRLESLLLGGSDQKINSRPFYMISCLSAPQYSSLIDIGMDGDTRPPLLLVTMATFPGSVEPGGVGVVVEAGWDCCIFFLFTFLSFARRFWNQIFTYVDRWGHTGHELFITQLR